MSSLILRLPKLPLACVRELSIESALVEIKDPITTIQAGAILGCDPSAIRHRVRQRTLEAERIGRDLIVSKKAVEAIKANTNGAKRGPKSTKSTKRKRPSRK